MACMWKVTVSRGLAVSEKTLYTGAYCLVGSTCWVCEICCALPRTTLHTRLCIRGTTVVGMFCFVWFNVLMFIPPYNITGLCSAATTAVTAVVT
jgi:hypothetical protein